MSLATPHKKTRRAATVAKQRLKSHVVGKKRKALQRQHQKVADTDDDDDDDPDATEEEEEPDDDDDEEEEDDCPITKRRKRSKLHRLSKSFGHVYLNSLFQISVAAYNNQTRKFHSIASSSSTSNRYQRLPLPPLQLRGRS